MLFGLSLKLGTMFGARQIFPRQAVRRRLGAVATRCCLCAKSWRSLPACAPRPLVARLLIGATFVQHYACMLHPQVQLVARNCPQFNYSSCQYSHTIAQYLWVSGRHVVMGFFRWARPERIFVAKKNSLQACLPHKHLVQFVALQEL